MQTSRLFARPVRVIKVGGSLLNFPTLAASARRWLSAQRPMNNVLLAGGGALADALRRYDAIHHLGEVEAHWMCIDAMSLTSTILRRVFPEAERACQWQQLVARLQSSKEEFVVFDARQFLREVEPNLDDAPLPHGWLITSDSIAGRLAQALGAEECVLLKSTDPPGEDWGELARQGYVDEHFPALVNQGGSYRAVNLRKT